MYLQDDTSVSADEQTAALPTLRVSRELQSLLDHLSEHLRDVIAGESNPELRSSLLQLQQLQSLISLGFLRIRDLLSRSPETEEERFLRMFFFRNYSIISENTRAAKSILKYVLHDLSWYTRHSRRITDCLKALYAELIALKIECRDQYRMISGKTMEFDFLSGEGKAGPGGEEGTALSVTQAFQILSLPEDAGREEVKAAFRKQAKILHPDLNPHSRREDFLRAQQAYRKLLSIVR